MTQCRLLRMSLTELAEAMRLPEGTVIVAVDGSSLFSSNEVLLKVAHPDFCLKPEGAPLPVVNVFTERKTQEVVVKETTRWE